MTKLSEQKGKSNEYVAVVSRDTKGGTYGKISHSNNQDKQRKVSLCWLEGGTAECEPRDSDEPCVHVLALARDVRQNPSCFISP